MMIQNLVIKLKHLTFFVDLYNFEPVVHRQTTVALEEFISQNDFSTIMCDKNCVDICSCRLQMIALTTAQ